MVRPPDLKLNRRGRTEGYATRARELFGLPSVRGPRRPCQSVLLRQQDRRSREQKGNQGSEEGKTETEKMSRKYATAQRKEEGGLHHNDEHQQG